MFRRWESEHIHTWGAHNVDLVSSYVLMYVSMCLLYIVLHTMINGHWQDNCGLIQVCVMQMLSDCTCMLNYLLMCRCGACMRMLLVQAVGCILLWNNGGGSGVIKYTHMYTLTKQAKIWFLEHTVILWHYWHYENLVFWIGTFHHGTKWFYSHCCSLFSILSVI